MDSAPTFESVTEEALALLHDWIAVARAVLADVAEVERTNRKRSKRDKAIGRWQIYLGVMLVKVGEGVATLAPTRNARPMVVLSRSMYEYYQKARFFLSHRKQAFEQYASIGARMFADLSKFSHPDPRMGPSLVAAYLEWKRTSGNRDEFSGNVALLNMHLDSAKREDVKTDKNGAKYTEWFQTAYGLPSLYAHGEPLLMPEVFPRINDDSDWEFREDVTYLDVLAMVSIASSYLNHWSASVSKVYNLDFGRIRALGERMNGRIKNEGQVRGINVTFVPRKKPQE